MEYCHCATIKKKLEKSMRNLPLSLSNLVLKYHLSPSFSTPLPSPPLLFLAIPHAFEPLKMDSLKIPTSMLGCTCKWLIDSPGVSIMLMFVSFQLTYVAAD